MMWGDRWDQYPQNMHLAYDAEVNFSLSHLETMKTVKTKSIFPSGKCWKMMNSLAFALEVEVGGCLIAMLENIPVKTFFVWLLINLFKSKVSIVFTFCRKLIPES